MIDQNQQQTKDTFAFKWAKRDTYESDAVKIKAYQWLLDRYFGSEDERQSFIERNSGKKILDAGCGSGYSASVIFGQELNGMQYLGVDISDSVKVAEERFAELSIKGEFLQASIETMNLDEKFDVIFSEGVIHHTSNPAKTFKNLVSHLNSGGEIMFYVYKKKAPVREFTDDFIREKLTGLSDEDAWQALVPLSKLGKTLGDLNIEIELDEDIDLLQIPKGKHNLQRFFYWFFIKMYYDEKFNIDEMNHINFDWFRPLNCYRFEPTEIEQWLAEAGLQKIRFIVEEAGITAIGKKR